MIKGRWRTDGSPAECEFDLALAIHTTRSDLTKKYLTRLYRAILRANGRNPECG